MKIELKYCASWGYEPNALSLTGKILDAFKQKVGELKLIPASGGCFEFKIDGELIYSKLATGQFPDEATMVQQVRSRLPAKK